MNYYNEIKKQIINNEITKKIKDYSKNKSDLETYYQVGKLLSEAKKRYGEGVIKEYSCRLSKELNKNYSTRTLYNMRLYYEKICCNEKLQPVATILTWSHYCELLRIKDENEILYYITICKQENLSKRELIQKLKNNEYERLPKETKEKLSENREIEIQDLVKNPIIIKNSNKYENISEKVLQKLILEDISSFLKELGSGFSFIANEYKIKLGNKYNFIDLLLYNIRFKCYTVVELKTTNLKKEHIGQIETYMHYIDKNIKTIEEDRTIGIIIVKDNDKYVMEYCSDERILAKEYKMI